MLLVGVTRMPSAHAPLYDIDVIELNETSPISIQPSGFNDFELMPHQLRALHRCRYLEECDVGDTDQGEASRTAFLSQTSIGVYADRVGAGKSHVMIALILGDKERAHQFRDVAPKDNVRTLANGRIMIREPESLRLVKTTVIVVPHILASQWEEYLRPMQNIESINAFVVKTRLGMNRLADDENIDGMDVILVTNTFYGDLARMVAARGIKPRRVIIDEADSIAITHATLLSASFSWFVTASYGNLMFPRGNIRHEYLLQRDVVVARGIAHAGFVRALFTELFVSLSRSQLNCIVVKNSDESVLQSLHVHQVIHKFIPSHTPNAVRVLSGIANNRIIECLNAGDVVGAVQLIAPSHTHTAQNVVMVMSEAYTRQLGNAERMLVMATDTEMVYETQTARDADVKRWTCTAREIKHKIDCIRARLLDEDTCFICLDRVKVRAVAPCCTTSTCLECITRWITHHDAPACAMCRHPLTVADLHVILPDGIVRPPNQASFPGGDYIGAHNTKMENLETIMRHHIGRDRKALIFSNHNTSFDEICMCLRRLGRSFDFICGNHNRVANSVRKFKDNTTDVLLVNASSYGSGINLENTTDILMFHALDTDIEKQVIGRAHRMGRTSDLRVWHLLHDNEMRFAMSADNPSLP